MSVCCHIFCYFEVFIETTGLALPGPVVQAFFMHGAMSKWTKIDGVITLVGCPNFDFFTTDDVVKNETSAQIGFADRLILTKTDLCERSEIDRVKSRLVNMSAAPIIEAVRGNISLSQVVGIDAFDLDRVGNKNVFVIFDYFHKYNFSKLTK